MTASNFIEGLKLRYFRPSEILFKGNSDVELKLNSLPPRKLWKNIVPTAWVADLARAEYGGPIQVLSGYRNKAYNSAIGGARSSQHKEFTALDLGCKRPDKLYNILLSFRLAGVFKGGIGKYPSFVHLDTRGENATW